MINPFHSQVYSLESIKANCRVKYIKKRNGEKQDFDVTHIIERLEKLSFNLDKTFVNIPAIVTKVVQGMHDGISTETLDDLAAETCAYMNIIHPHYSLLAARIVVSNLHKETKDDFAATIHDLHTYVDKGIILFKFIKN